MYCIKPLSLHYANKNVYNIYYLLVIIIFSYTYIWYLLYSRYSMQSLFKLWIFAFGWYWKIKQNKNLFRQFNFFLLFFSIRNIICKHILFTDGISLIYVEKKLKINFLQWILTNNSRIYCCFISFTYDFQRVIHF